MTMIPVTMSTTNTSWRELLQPLPLQCCQIISHGSSLGLKNAKTGTIERQQSTSTDTTHHDTVNLKTCHGPGRIAGTMDMGFITVINQTGLTGNGIHNQKPWRRSEMPIYCTVKPLILDDGKTEFHTYTPKYLYMHKIPSQPDMSSVFVHIHINILMLVISSYI